MLVQSTSITLGCHITHCLLPTVCSNAAIGLGFFFFLYFIFSCCSLARTLRRNDNTKITMSGTEVCLQYWNVLNIVQENCSSFKEFFLNNFKKKYLFPPLIPNVSFINSTRFLHKEVWKSEKFYCSPFCSLNCLKITCLYCIHTQNRTFENQGEKKILSGKHCSLFPDQFGQNIHNLTLLIITRL